MESLLEHIFFQLMKNKTFTANQNQLELCWALKLKLTCSLCSKSHKLKFNIQLVNHGLYAIRCGQECLIFIYQTLKPFTFVLVGLLVYTPSILIFRQEPEVLQVWRRYHRCHRLAPRIWLHQHHAHCCGALSTSSWTVKPIYIFTCKQLFILQSRHFSSKNRLVVLFTCLKFPSNSWFFFF